MDKFKLLFLNIYMTIILYAVSAFNCIDNSNRFYCKLGTRTPYRFIANFNDSQLKFPGCKEKKIWIMIRHGTRLPGKKYFQSMKTNLPKIQKEIMKTIETKNSKLPYGVLKQLSEWKLPFDENEAMYLTGEGENELIDLAERMQMRFPTLLLQDYCKNMYKFKYTATQRTKLSAESFVLGLFGEYQSRNVSFPEPEHKDPILRFYKNCERWSKEINKNPETYKEQNLFIQSKFFNQTLFEISKKIGYTLDNETVRLIYRTCGYEIAWNKVKKSPWCQLLSYNNIKVLEYVDDLDYYWSDGHGYNLNYKQACKTILDVFKLFSSPQKPFVTAYFTHSGSILKLLSILGIAKDKNPLTHTCFSLQKDFRQWKVSLIDSFASNIAFVLYDCQKIGPSILVLHQERIVKIPGCYSRTLCPLSIMKRLFPDTEEKCQFNDMCSIQ